MKDDLFFHQLNMTLMSFHTHVYIRQNVLHISIFSQGTERSTETKEMKARFNPLQLGHLIN